ncbi:MAG: helix-turn-helix domain-containing protein [bacterium]
MTNKVTFETLPAALELVDEKLDRVIGMLAERIEKPEEIPKFLNVESTIKYLHRVGFPMKKSTLYKLTASGKIPVHRDGNRLIFVTAEIEEWCDATLATKDVAINDNIINHARKMAKKH